MATDEWRVVEVPNAGYEPYYELQYNRGRWWGGWREVERFKTEREAIACYHGMNRKPRVVWTNSGSFD